MVRNTVGSCRDASAGGGAWNFVAFAAGKQTWEWCLLMVALGEMPSRFGASSFPAFGRSAPPERFRASRNAAALSRKGPEGMIPPGPAVRVFFAYNPCFIKSESLVDAAPPAEAAPTSVCAGCVPSMKGRK
ncbi:hypothetical protein JCM14124_14260 [Humidesulfovibrio idahonensis]